MHVVEEIAGPAPEIPLEYDQISREGEGFWDDVNGGYHPEDPVLTARREAIDWVHSDGVFEIVPMQECKDAGRKPLELIWVGTDQSVDPAHKKIRSRLCAREYKTKKQGKIQRALLPSQLFYALEAVKALVSIKMSASWPNKGKRLKLRHYDISRAHIQGTAQRLINIRLPAEDRQKNGEDKVGKEHVWISRCFSHLAT